MRSQSAHLLSHLSRSLPSRRCPSFNTSRDGKASAALHQLIVTTPNLNLPYHALKQVPEPECAFSTVHEVEAFYRKIFRTNSVPACRNEFRPKTPNSRLARYHVVKQNTASVKHFRRKPNTLAIQTDFTPAVDVVCFANKDQRRSVSVGAMIERAELLKNDPCASSMVKIPQPADIHTEPEMVYCSSLDASPQRFFTMVRRSFAARQSKFFTHQGGDEEAEVDRYLNFAGKVCEFQATDDTANNYLQAKMAENDGPAFQANAQLANDSFIERYNQEFAASNKSELERSYNHEQIQIKHLISSMAEKESQMLFSKFISTSKQSYFQAANEMQTYFQQYLDIIYYKDFGSIHFLTFHSKISKNYQYLAVNTSIMTNLQQHMFLGVIQKQLKYCPNAKFDIFSYSWACSMQQLFSKLKLSSASQQLFKDLSYKPFFQLLNYVLLSKPFYSIQQLADNAASFNAVASLSVLNLNLFTQCEVRSEITGPFSQQLLDYLIVYCMRNLATCYQSYQLACTEKISRDAYYVFGNDIMEHTRMKPKQSFDLDSITLVDLVTENMYEYNFRKADYVANNQFLTYFSGSLSPYITDAVYIYFKYHFSFFFYTTQESIVETARRQIVPRMQIAAMLLVNVVKGYLLAESTNNIVQSAFQGVTPRNALSFGFSYQCVVQLLITMLSNEFSDVYLRQTNDSMFDIALAKHATFCSQILKEILLINYMLLGNDQLVYYSHQGDVSKMLNLERKEYAAYQSLGNDVDAKIVKNFAYQAIQALWVLSAENELFSQRLIKILQETDILAAKVADITTNKRFLDVYAKYKRVSARISYFYE